MSPFRDTTEARVTTAARHLEELGRERQQSEQRYRAARAALESSFLAPAPELPPVPVPLAALRRGPVFAWGCVGGLIAAFVLLVLAG